MWALVSGVVIASSQPARAQNSDLGFLFGVVQRNAEIRPGFLRADAQASFQINYAWQFHEGPRGRWYVELPILFVGSANGEIAEDVVGRSGGSIFVIPGIRYQRNLTPRIACMARPEWAQASAARGLRS